jgi:hypothetical protein
VSSPVRVAGVARSRSSAQAGCAAAVAAAIRSLAKFPGCFRSRARH